MTRMSRRFWPPQAVGQAATARSRMVRRSSGTKDRSVTSYTRPMPWQCGHAPSGVFGEKSSAYSMGWRAGYCPAREYSSRSRLEIVVALPTEERAVGVPRCCCRATAGGRPSMASTSGVPAWSIRRRA